jgi:rare lipoprotein A
MSTTTGSAVRGTSLAALMTALISAPTTADAKTPGSTYCFYSTCHRVLTLAETRAAIGKPRPMHASHYDAPSRDRFNPSLITSSGELFRPEAANNAASPIYPDGTLVAVYAPGTKRGAVVRINNAGPYWGNRLIDLSRGLAEKLGIAKSGVGRVVVEVLAAPSAAEAKYARGRRYAPVQGFVGKVAGVEAVRETWQISQGLKSVPSPTPGTGMIAAEKSQPQPQLQPIKPAPAVAAVAAPKAAPVATSSVDLAVALAEPISPDDMRTASGLGQPSIVATSRVVAVHGKGPARPLKAAKPAAPRINLAKMQTPPFR